MNTNPVTPRERKLRNLRKVLWVVFSAVAITILLVGGLSVPAALLINQTTDLSTLFGNMTGVVMISLLAVAFVKIAISGIICLVIYFIFKYRIEKDDDLFL